MYFYYNNSYTDSITADASKYLIQLYTSTRYHCDRYKLQVLIILAHLALLADDNTGLLGDEPIVATTLGLGVQSVSVQFGIVNFNVTDEIHEIAKVNKLDNKLFSQAYRYDVEVLHKKKKYLRAMFEAFGAYPSGLLLELTKYMDLYPRNVNFLRMPRYAVNITQEKILDYVDVLRHDMDYTNGIYLIKSEIHRCVKQCKNLYIDV